MPKQTRILDSQSPDSGETPFVVTSLFSTPGTRASVRSDTATHGTIYTHAKPFYILVLCCFVFDTVHLAADVRS